MASSIPSDPSEVPLQYQRAFGAGIKRKRIDFVPQSSDLDSSSSVQRRGEAASSRSPQDVYLSIVMPKPARTPNTAPTSTPPAISPAPPCIPALDTALQAEPLQTQPEAPSIAAPDPTDVDATAPLCPICNLPCSTPTSTPHEATLPHQISLGHSHPPSSVDRTRKGLHYLRSYGWDPDARLGLGVAGSEGRLYPIQPKKKAGVAGVGAREERKEEREARERKERKLGAGEVRKLEEERRKKGKRIERGFWGNGEVEKHLGEAAV